MSSFNLDQIFNFKSQTHEHTIRWTRIGSPSLPPLVFIHGTPWSSVVWFDVVQTLASRYSIYVYDHGGFGLSASPKRLEGIAGDRMLALDPSLALRAEASAALFKHWDLKELPNVVCHDNGGLVSLRLLLQHQIKFKSLCLIDVVVLGASGLPFFKLVAENESMFTAVPPHLLAGFVRGYVTSAAHRPLAKEVEDMLSAPWLADGSQGPERFLQEMIQAHHRDVSGVKEKYGSVGELVPVKIIWGKEDSWIPSDTAFKLKDTLNAREVVLVEAAGHLIHYDQPSKLAFEIGIWLEKHNGSG